MTLRRGDDGFTLVEVLCALVLFALISGAVTFLGISSMRQTVQNGRGDTAVMLAQDEIERVRALRYDEIQPTTASASIDGQSYWIKTAVAGDRPEAGMKQITVTVGWTGLRGTETYAIDTIYTAVTS